jgi:AAA+ ATPase superfamily predicted ATPase
MAKFFPLFKNNNDIEQGINDDFINILGKCNNPHIICVYGDARLGKSTKLNQIINGVKSHNFFGLTGPFKTRLEIHTAQTKGVDFYGPIKVKDLVDKNDLDINEFDNEIKNDELFFVDTEGLKSIDQVTKTCVAGILTILQIAAIKILYMPILDNEKLDEAAKNSNLTNILN